jgi:hypothetical protein
MGTVVVGAVVVGTVVVGTVVATGNEDDGGEMVDVTVGFDTVTRCLFGPGRSGPAKTKVATRMTAAATATTTFRSVR